MRFVAGPVCLSLLSAVSNKPMIVCLIPPCGIRVNCQFAQSVGAQTMCRQRGNGRDGSSLNETLTSQRATRPRQPDSRVDIGASGGRGGDETTVDCATLFPGVWTDDAGGWQGTWGTSSTGWRMGPKRVAKTLEQCNKLPPCPLRLIRPSHPFGHFLAPDPRISPHLFCSSHRLHTVEPL